MRVYHPVSSQVTVLNPPHTSHTLTGGADSLIRIWRTDKGETQEPDTVLDADDAITAIAVYVRPSPRVAFTSDSSRP